VSSSESYKLSEIICGDKAVYLVTGGLARVVYRYPDRLLLGLMVHRVKSCIRMLQWMERPLRRYAYIFDSPLDRQVYEVYKRAYLEKPTEQDEARMWRRKDLRCDVNPARMCMGYPQSLSSDPEYLYSLNTGSSVYDAVVNYCKGMQMTLLTLPSRVSAAGLRLQDLDYRATDRFFQAGRVMLGLSFSTVTACHIKRDLVENREPDERALSNEALDKMRLQIIHSVGAGVMEVFDLLTKVHQAAESWGRLDLRPGMTDEETGELPLYPVRQLLEVEFPFTSGPKGIRAHYEKQAQGEPKEARRIKRQGGERLTINPGGLGLTIDGRASTRVSGAGLTRPVEPMCQLPLPRIGDVSTWETLFGALVRFCARGGSRANLMDEPDWRVPLVLPAWDFPRYYSLLTSHTKSPLTLSPRGWCRSWSEQAGLPLVNREPAEESEDRAVYRALMGLTDVTDCSGSVRNSTTPLLICFNGLGFESFIRCADVVVNRWEVSIDDLANTINLLLK
jgi:hypothetical protein